MNNSKVSNDKSKKVSMSELTKALEQEIESDNEKSSTNRDQKQLKILDKSHKSEIISVLTSAFSADDPMTDWIVGISESPKYTGNNVMDKETKSSVTRKVAEYLLNIVNRPIIIRKKGVVLGVTSSSSNDNKSELKGVLAFVPSSKSSESFFDIVTSMLAFGIPPFFKKPFKDQCGPMAAKRLFICDILLKKRYEILHNTLKTKRYIYLPNIGVHENSQGQGFGGSLLRPLFRAADSLNATIYLETESEENESLYKHYGFRTVEVVDLCVPGDTRVDATQRMWLMVREA